MEKLLVSASTGAMGSLLGKLGTMLSDQYKQLNDVRDDIKFLKDELEAMHSFLLVMADVENPDHQAKLRADAVRELSYEIEDSIDKFMVLVEREPSNQSNGFGKLFSKTMKKIADIKTRHKIAKDVKDIMSQIKEVSERYARYKIDESSKTRNAIVDPRLLAIYKDASELVGIDGPRDELVNWFRTEESESAHQPKVASIVGYGGLGKTTLAKQVYDKLGASFDCRAFVSISRNPDMKKILSSVLYQIQNKTEAHAGSEDLQNIIDQIREFLKDKRFAPPSIPANLRIAEPASLMPHESMPGLASLRPKVDQNKIKDLCWNTIKPIEVPTSRLIKANRFNQTCTSRNKVEQER